MKNFLTAQNFRRPEGEIKCAIILQVVVVSLYNVFYVKIADGLSTDYELSSKEITKPRKSGQVV